MIVLHGALLDERIFVWGEVPAEPEKRPAAQGRRHAAPPLPYDAGFDAVAKALKSLPGDVRPTKRRAEEAAIWLPTRNGYAMPSSALATASKPAS